MTTPDGSFRVDPDKVLQKLLERNAALTNEVAHLQVLVEQLVEHRDATAAQQAPDSDVAS